MATGASAEVIAMAIAFTGTGVVTLPRGFQP
jgi:hypothetical protein